MDGDGEVPRAGDGGGGLAAVQAGCAIGVLGAFFKGGQQFLSAKTQFCSAKKYPLRGGQIFQFCSAKLMHHSFVSHCSASLNSLLPVSQYIDTAFADKGSHQKRNWQPKYSDTSKFG